VLSDRSLDEEEVLLTMGEAFKEVKLLQANFLEKVGISHVMFDDGTTCLKLVDLVPWEVPEAHSLK
jgi:hypothetical protein